MTSAYRPPLVGENQISSYDRLLVADAGYMATLTESAPKLFELLPLSGQVPIPFELAGVHAQEPTANPRQPSKKEGTSPSYSVTAAYTPDGTLGWPLRTLVTRLALFDDNHTDDDIDACYERKLDQELTKEEPTTKWIDTTHDEGTVHGHRRTTFSQRRPLLYKHGQYDGGVSRPVFVYAFVLERTDWGFIETGLYLSPDPNPGRPLDIVETVTGTIAHEAKRLPRPVRDQDWPHLHLHDLSHAEIIADVRRNLDVWADDGEIEVGRLLTLIREEYDVSNEVVQRIISGLQDSGDIADGDAGCYEVA
jgi:hypothetical protein